MIHCLGRKIVLLILLVSEIATSHQERRGGGLAVATAAVEQQQQQQQQQQTPERRRSLRRNTGKYDNTEESFDYDEVAVPGSSLQKGKEKDDDDDNNLMDDALLDDDDDTLLDDDDDILLDGDDGLDKDDSIVSQVAVMSSPHHQQDTNEQNEKKNDDDMDDNFSDDAQPRIAGGSPAAVDQFPWFVTVSFGSCGGSLIHSDFVLTAAHCGSWWKRHKVVRIGATHVWQGGTTAKIARRFRHPRFSRNNYIENDIMLVQLTEPQYHIPTLQLNTDPQRPQADELATIMGHGQIDHDGPTSPWELLTVDVFTLSTEECREIWPRILDEGTQLCAGNSTVHDNCRGDSGGPLVSMASSNDEAVVQYGLVSYGWACPQPGGVYTRVSHYVEWIEHQICTWSNDKPSTCPPMPSTAHKTTFAPTVTAPIASPSWRPPTTGWNRPGNLPPAYSPAASPVHLGRNMAWVTPVASPSWRSPTTGWNPSGDNLSPAYSPFVLLP